MKKCLLLFLLLILISCSGRPMVNTSVNKNVNFNRSSRMAIVPGAASSFGLLLPDALLTEFLGLGFNIVERNEIAKLLREQNLSLSGILENQDYSKIGKIANIETLIIVVSKENSNGAVASASIKVINVTNGYVIISSTYSQPAPDNPAYVNHQNINQTAKTISKSIETKLMK